ncbi:MAG: hypothetical protein K9K67_16215 [Bacteriovoracaceae bacterium]|nr:hypothetical protein [Bacteriovoracaceae bacterium]
MSKITIKNEYGAIVPVEDTLSQNIDKLKELTVRLRNFDSELQKYSTGKQEVDKYVNKRIVPLVRKISFFLTPIYQIFSAKITVEELNGCLREFEDCSYQVVTSLYYNPLFENDVERKSSLIEKEGIGTVREITTEMILILSAGVGEENDELLASVHENTNKLLVIQKEMKNELSSLSNENFENIVYLVSLLESNSKDIAEVLKNTTVDSKEELAGAVDSLVKGDFFTTVYKALKVIKRNVNSD